jgi:hypothetical protein
MHQAWIFASAMVGGVGLIAFAPTGAPVVVPEPSPRPSNSAARQPALRQGKGGM